jgi:hypothetical protein
VSLREQRSVSACASDHGTRQFLDSEGSSPPAGRRRSRRARSLAIFGTTLSVLGCIAAPAFAAAPETPELRVEGVRASEAVFQGTLNPHATEEVEGGSYHFAYNAGTSCAGGTETSPGASMNQPDEALQGEPVSGLTANTEYTVCLIEENASGTATATVHFTTALPPEAPETSSPAKSITAVSAELEGTLNPHTTATDGWYFAYSNPGGASCTEGPNTGQEPEVHGKALAEHKTLAGLEPNQRYVFCLVAVNSAGETAAGNEVSFQTKPAPASIESESVSNVKASEVTFEGTVNANNQVTECHFQYGSSSVTESTIACTPELLKGFEAQSVGPKNTEGAPAPTGVSEGTVYHYEILTKNGKGEEATGPEQRFQTFEAPTMQAPTEVSKTAWELHGALDPNNARSEEPGTYEFVYRQSSGECEYVLSAAEEHQLEVENRGTELEADRARQAENKYTTQEPASGTQGQTVEAEVSGLLPGAPYTACLLVRNAAGNQAAISGRETFTTVPAPPTVLGESASDIETIVATLEAEIVPEGAATTTHFEYLTQAQYEADGNTFAAGTEKTSESEPIGADDATHPATPVRIEGLTPATTYRYRVAATNECEPGNQCITHGKSKTFTTPAASVSEPPETCPNAARRAEQPDSHDLPDCRAYEMVSPVETNGNDATDPFIEAGHVRASESKEKEAKGEEETPAIAYTSRGSFAEPNGATFESQLLSRREPEHDRWGTRSITVPYEHDQDAEVPVGYTGVFFTPELTEGLATTAADLTSEAPEGLNELYLVDLTDGPGPYELVSHLSPSEEEYATPFKLGASVYPLGASSNLSHVVFTDETRGASGPLREAVNGQVVFVGVSNEGQVWTGAAVGSSSPTNLEGGGENVWRAVSEDGSRVIFNYSGELYARVNAGAKAEPEPEREQSELNGQEECIERAKACTVKLSAGAATYWGANTAGSKIFYVENGDLYEYELPIGAVKGQARALTSGGEVQGVVQVSEDGSYVYFVANSVLGDAAAHGVTPGNCGVKIVNYQPHPTGTACNLYVSHEDGEPAFIATLSTHDGSDWLEGPGGDTAVLAPGELGGARLAFISGDSLTGYDNQQAGPGDCESEHVAPFISEGGKCREIYLYGAESESHPPSLVCASCEPSGARPVGPASLATGRYGVLGGASNYRPRDLLADGSLFFDSSDAFVAHSSGGVQSVYEYEDGHVYPISDPGGRYDSFFLDATADGTDVFFATADQLLPQDKSTNVVVYDARTGGGFSVPAVTSSCTSDESCKHPNSSEPGVYGPGASATFSGPGNLAPSPPPAAVKSKLKALTRAQKLAEALKACRKDKSKAKRKNCEASARKKYGAARAKKAKRATNDRRTQ